MAGKYNRRHDDRSQSRYPERLRRRGLTNVDVRMPDLATLRRWQHARPVAVVDPDPDWDGS